jgi:hypothetical protein
MMPTGSVDTGWNWSDPTLELVVWIVAATVSLIAMMWGILWLLFRNMELVK